MKAHPMSSFNKFDVTNVPNDFMMDNETLQIVNNTISKLECSFRTQSDVNDIYTDWCNIIHQNMSNRLPCKIVQFGCNNKKGVQENRGGRIN